MTHDPAAPSEREPDRAPVRPRIVRPGSALPLLLEDEVRDLLDAGAPVHVELVGPQGSGKTTALRHLAATFEGHPGLRLVDGECVVQSGSGTVTVTARCRASKHIVTYRLQPWQQDDVIEYLLARHPADIARVLAVWQTGPPHDLQRSPGVCRTVLDRIAADPTISCPRAALAIWLPAELGAQLDDAVRFAVRTESAGARGMLPLAFALAPHSHLLQLATVRGVLAADYALQVATSQPRWRPIAMRWSTSTRDAITQALRSSGELLAALERVAAQARVRHKSFVFSALALHAEGYRPPRALRGRMMHAWLAKCDLRGHRIRADLSAATLDAADLRAAQFVRTRLTNASMRRADASGASFSTILAHGLVAPGITAIGSSWWRVSLPKADLRDADLGRARLTRCELEGADLAGASLRGAQLQHSTLTSTELRGADLTDTNLTGARLDRIDLRDVTGFANVTIDGARLGRCQLEGLAAPGLSAAATRFVDSHLTGTRWPDADLRAASFSGCGLAEVDWQGADLRDADLRQSTFHLGNSRSGLVDSPTASEGSRTGFYTDESLEDRFQSPEEVRKANLRDCDLRGANLTGVDFYLVDLRGAKLDPAQRDWLRRCRAILDREMPAE